MEISKIRLIILDLIETVFGSFDPVHNAIQFFLLFVLIIGSLSLLIKSFSWRSS